MNATNTKHDPPEDRYLRAASQPRPVEPFAVSCRFDRARGEFTVRAGARAGAAAVAGVAALALGTLGFVRSFLAPAEVILAKAPPPPAAVVEKAPAPATAAKANVPAAVVTTTPAPLPAAKQLPPRTPGLNYLVLQSLPSKREAAAAQERLEAKGVAASVEQDLPGWSKKTTFTVVGLTGFDLKREQAQFDRHLNDLKELKGVKLKPKPYKWRGTEVASTGR